MTRAGAPDAGPRAPGPGRPLRPILQSYGLYVKDSGRPTRRTPLFFCASDEDALRYAEQRREDRAAELRSGDRLVASWPRGGADAITGPRR